MLEVTQSYTEMIGECGGNRAGHGERKGSSPFLGRFACQEPGVGFSL